MSTGQLETASKTYWDQHWAERKAPGPGTVLFRDLFRTHLPYDSSLHCLEVGCVPGDFSCYLHEEFGYQIHGVDYSDHIHAMPASFETRGIRDCKFYQADFLSWEPGEQFDLVVSFGFVEHFTNYEDIIRKHISLVAPGGWLIITMPNFRYGQHLLHRLCDRASLARHNLKAMNVKMLRRLMREGGLQALRLGYYGTFEFWVEPDPRTPFQVWMVRQVLRVTSEAQYIVRHRKMDRPNRWFSPYIVCVARKPR